MKSKINGGYAFYTRYQLITLKNNFEFIWILNNDLVRNKTLEALLSRRLNMDLDYLEAFHQNLNHQTLLILVVGLLGISLSHLITIVLKISLWKST